ncbi:MAG: hypothetical protein CMJ83_20300 [Planctomycetes bacterium]|nr:hypothetical protein [Planctomycetota bacterium]
MGGQSRKLGLARKLLISFTVVSVILSHLQFRFGGRNPNWMQTVVPGVAILVMYSLIVMARNVSPPAKGTDSRRPSAKASSA